MKLIRTTREFVLRAMEHCRLIELKHEIKVGSLLCMWASGAVFEGEFLMGNRYRISRIDVDAARSIIAVMVSINVSSRPSRLLCVHGKELSW
jgi:hypothetical protein